MSRFVVTREAVVERLPGTVSRSDTPATVTVRVDWPMPTVRFEVVARWDRDFQGRIFPELSDFEAALNEAQAKFMTPPVRWDGVNLAGTLFGIEVC